MRLSGLLLGATALLATLTPCVAQEIAPETITVEKLPADMKRVYLVDLTINHVADGKVWVLDGDKMEVKGMLELGFLGLFYQPPKSDKIYIATTFYDRLTRGNRHDVMTVFDANTLEFLEEYPIPMKRVMPIQYRPLMTGSADGKFIYIQNATPATSITVTNLAKKSSVELQAAGCYGTYPSIKSLRVSTLCGDGTIGTYTLNAEGTEGKRQASDKLFDADKDAWFIHGEKNGENYNFISFQSVMHTVSLEGDKAKLVDSFPMAEGVEGSWRPGGYMPFAVNAEANVAYVLMHSNGAEGTHKYPSEEIWSVDLKAKKVIARSKVPTMVSMTISEGNTLYGINPFEPSVVKMSIDPAAGHAVTVVGNSKVGETATQIEVSQ